MIEHPDYCLKRWFISQKAESSVFSNLSEYPPLVGQLLYNRGITTREQALEYFQDIPLSQSDPFSLSGMSLAVERISAAVAQNQKIAIYGDYDVDGVTSTALLYELLSGLGADVMAYIPDRFEEGYGLNTAALEQLSNQGVKLVISVDCGIRSCAEADFCRNSGLDLIITDHHHPLDEIPDALAVINPKLSGQAYQYPDLAGVGVAFRLAQAFLLAQNGTSEPADRWLDLVALGTIADLAPLTGENRTLVKQGLSHLRKGKRMGMVQLCRIAGVNQANLTTSDIGFMLGPRLNASGRLETAMNSFRLLVSNDVNEAAGLAAILNKNNTERQELTRQTQQAAAEQISTLDNEDYLLFVVDSTFNEGIVGLAASRLAEQYHRPAIVGVANDTTTRCSCRSIACFHITRALDECSDLFIRHGGHAAAAGFTLFNSNLDELKRRLNEITYRELCDKDLTPQLCADAEIQLGDLTPALLGYLDQIQPTGYGNPEPYFVARRLTVKSKKAIGVEGKHLKMSVTDGWLTMDAICFRFGYLLNHLPEKVDVLFSFERNYYNGQVYLQINVKDIQTSA